MPESTLQLGLFFDGTGNHLANASPDEASNIAALFALYPDTPSVHCLSLYIEGIGTREGAPDSAFAMATGRGRLGWRTAVQRAHDGVRRRLLDWTAAHPGRPIARLDIDLFGFSRGAACARYLANTLTELEAALRRDSALAPALRQSTAPVIRLRFLGLFDTVDSVRGSGPAERLALEKGAAQRVVHLVAGDEHRFNFPLTRAGVHDRVLPGAHADIGGGYPAIMEECLLLSRPEGSRVAPGTALTQAGCVKHAEAIMATVAPRFGFERRVRTWQHDILASGRGDRIEAVQVHAAVEGRRQVRNTLSRVYLEVMHRLARSEGVPLRALPGFSYPVMLQPIAEVLVRYGCGEAAQLVLTPAQWAVLYREYIHHSSHWNTSGVGQTSDVESVFVHRPEPSGRRRVAL